MSLQDLSWTSLQDRTLELEARLRGMGAFDQSDSSTVTVRPLLSSLSSPSDHGGSDDSHAVATTTSGPAKAPPIDAPLLQLMAQTQLAANDWQSSSTLGAGPSELRSRRPQSSPAETSYMAGTSTMSMSEDVSMSSLPAPTTAAGLRHAAKLDSARARLRAAERELTEARDDLQHAEGSERDNREHLRQVQAAVGAAQARVRDAATIVAYSRKSVGAAEKALRGAAKAKDKRGPGKRRSSHPRSALSVGVSPTPSPPRDGSSLGYRSQSQGHMPHHVPRAGTLPLDSAMRYSLTQPMRPPPQQQILSDVPMYPSHTPPPQPQQMGLAPLAQPEPCWCGVLNCATHDQQMYAGPSGQPQMQAPVSWGWDAPPVPAPAFDPHFAGTHDYLVAAPHAQAGGAGMYADPASRITPRLAAAQQMHGMPERRTSSAGSEHQDVPSIWVTQPQPGQPGHLQ